VGDAPELTPEQKKEQQIYEWNEEAQNWQLSDPVPYPTSTRQWNEDTLAWEII
jgi:hypothetical protein